MSRLSVAARKAIEWLREAWGHYKENRDKIEQLRGVLSIAMKDNRRLESAFAAIEKVERTWGAHTSFWARMERDAKDKIGSAVPADEVRYIWEFKRVFDRYLKKPFV